MPHPWEHRRLEQPSAEGVTWCVWPCGTICEMAFLESYLKFMSDDCLTCVTPDEDADAVPSYDEIATYKRIYHDTEMAHKP